jgi:hypothetical protein
MQEDNIQGNLQANILDSLQDNLQLITKEHLQEYIQLNMIEYIQIILHVYLTGLHTLRHSQVNIQEVINIQGNILGYIMQIMTDHF